MKKLVEIMRNLEDEKDLDSVTNLLTQLSHPIFALFGERGRVVSDCIN